MAKRYRNSLPIGFPVAFSNAVIMTIPTVYQASGKLNSNQHPRLQFLLVNVTWGKKEKRKKNTPTLQIFSYFLPAHLLLHLRRFIFGSVTLPKNS